MFNIASKARPYLGAVVLTTALLTAGGVYCWLRMPSGVYPEVTFPRIAVVARVPGLSVPNMDVQVTQPLEQAVSTVIGVAQVRSKTIRGGSELSIDFNPGTDMRRAETMTWNRIGAIRSQLPANVELTVEQMTPSVFPIMSLVLYSESLKDQPAGPARDNVARELAREIRDYAFYQLAPLIKNVPDVLYANVAGGDIREIAVEARPEDLLAAGLSAADLADQIGKAHRLEPVGRIERPPYAFQVIVNTQAQTARDIGELVISTKNNQPLRVRDVADVRVLHQDRTLSIGYAGNDAVVITIFRRLDGNTVNISRDVRALLAKKPPPRNIQAQVVYDQATFVNTSVHNVRDAILIGGAFSILILMAFLRSWRATLISALAIPTTLAITFLFLYWSGSTLNLMSLGGLAVAIGLIIDDTVVVIENIARHLTKGEDGGSRIEDRTVGERSSILDPRSSRIDPVDAASSEITGAVVGSTFTTVLVFVPLAFITGVYGQFFASLCWSLSIAVLVSMVISLTLIPVFAAKFLAKHPPPPPGPIYNAVSQIYDRIFERTLAFPRLTLLLSLAMVGIGVVLYWGIPHIGKVEEPSAEIHKDAVRDLAAAPALPFPANVPWAALVQSTQKKVPPEPLLKPLETGLMPAMDEGAFVLDYWAPGGTPLARTEEMVRKIEEEVLQRNPDIDSYVRRTGAELGLFATQTNRGDVQIILRPSEQDPLRPWTLLKRVRPPFEEIEKQLKRESQKRAAKRSGGKIAEEDKPNPIAAPVFDALEAKYGEKFTEAQMWQETKDYLRAHYRRRPMAKRAGSTEPAIMDEVEDGIKDLFVENQLKIETVSIMQDELNDLSGANKPIEVKLFGPDHDTLRKLAGEVKEMLETKGKGKGIKEPLGPRDGNPDLLVQPDLARLDRCKLTAADLSRQLQAMFLGQVATQVRESSLRITDVRVRYPDRIRFGQGLFDPDRILNQWILLPEGAPPINSSTATTSTPLAGPARAVPLSALARLERVRSPDEQWRENQQPAWIVSAELNESEAGLDTVVSNIRQWMGGVNIPANYRWEIGGHYLHMEVVKRQFTVIMIVAVLLLYIMLAVQFKSVVLPLLIFMEQPLSIVSGLFALWITNTPLNMSSYMGIILLIGLDMKNGILLVEYIQQLRAQGMELRPALLLAGQMRLRPILMTSLAAILGLFPLALAIGPGAQMQQPLAIVVMGGLIANMLFTRMVIRAGYLVLEGPNWNREQTRRTDLPPAAGAVAQT
jgi:multidrug efflux pump subunit AcrB